MMDLSLKRIVAYLIDVCLISFVIWLLNYLPIDPYKDKYNETYETYQKYVENSNGSSSNEDELKTFTYDLAKYRTYSSVYSAVALIAYFGVIQYALKGQTVGKKIMKIRVVSNNDKKLNVWNYILRIVILNNIIFTFINIGGVYVLNIDKYYYLSYVVSMLTSLVSLLILMMIMFRHDGRGLHDYLANTKVVEDVINGLDVENKETIKEKVEKKEKKKN